MFWSFCIVRWRFLRCYCLFFHLSWRHVLQWRTLLMKSWKSIKYTRRKGDICNETWDGQRRLANLPLDKEWEIHPIKDTVEGRITVSSRLNRNVIVPRESEKEEIVDYFYKRSKGEASAKDIPKVCWHKPWIYTILD